MALYPPSPAPPVAGSSSSKNEKLIFAPSPDMLLSTPAGQAAIAARAAAHTAKAVAAGAAGGFFSPSLTSSGASTPASMLPRAGQFLRHEIRGGLRRADLDPQSPISQFHAWFAEAKAIGGIAHPETCTLSTASLPSGRVSARMVYLKELDRQGFVLYSNFGTSRKGDDLFGGSGDSDGRSAGNGWAALTFWWEALERQVRVEGRAARLPPAESQLYFDTRVRGSRIGAWASRQSAVLEPAESGGGADVGEDSEADDGRAQLDRWVAEVEARFGPSSKKEDEGELESEEEDHIPVPEFWGGLRIVPERVEFWQGRQNRLHDRFVYDRVHADGADGEDEPKEAWTLQRLSP